MGLRKQCYYCKYEAVVYHPSNGVPVCQEHVPRDTPVVPRPDKSYRSGLALDTGSDLDRTLRQWGFTRQPGESDQELRDRVYKTLSDMPPSQQVKSWVTRNFNSDGSEDLPTYNVVIPL